jgi:hypothetical protein
VRAEGEEHAGVRGGEHQGAAAAGGKGDRQVWQNHPGDRGQKWRGKCLLGGDAPAAPPCSSRELI